MQLIENELDKFLGCDERKSLSDGEWWLWYSEIRSLVGDSRTLGSKCVKEGIGRDFQQVMVSAVINREWLRCMKEIV